MPEPDGHSTAVATAVRTPPRVGPNRFARVALVVFVVLAGMGAVGVLAVVGLVMAISHIHLDFGSPDVSLASPSSYGMDMALSPDGSTAYVTEPEADRVDVIRDGVVVARVPLGHTPTGLAVTPDGREVWVADTGIRRDLTGLGEAGAISVVSALSDSVIATIPVGANPIGVAFSPDGSRAYVTNNGYPGSPELPSVTVIETADFTIVGGLTVPGGFSTAADQAKPTSVAVSPDGTRVWVSEANMIPLGSPSNDSVSVFDAATGAVVATVEVGGGPFFMTLSRDGDYAYVADKESCDLKEIDTATYQVVATVRWPQDQGCPYGIAAGPDDNVVYTVTGSDHTIPHQGGQGQSFGAVDFATSRVILNTGVGSDPVTVTMARDESSAYVVDGDRPTVDVVDPITGLITSEVSIFTSTHRSRAAAHG